MASNALVNYDAHEIAYYDDTQVMDPDAEEGEAIEFYPVPAGVPHDALGRLLKDPEDIIDPETLPEDVSKFISQWQAQELSSHLDWAWTSRFIWSDVPRTVIMKRLDIFQQDIPFLQYATTDAQESITIRNTGSWYPLRSIFFMDAATHNTTQLLLEIAGPPRRCKYRLQGKQNKRDLVKWASKEVLYGYLDPHYALGTSRFYVDYCDLPDRYFISSLGEPTMGMRRLYPFAAYATKQYYLLEKRVYSAALDAEGGWGHTYDIQCGAVLEAKKDWKLIGSFYGFDHQLPSSSKYTVYRRKDPFPRMQIARDVIQNASEWSADFAFYAFDIAVPGSMRYGLHHCLRSIHTNALSVHRHRLTTEDHRTPWEFRMNIFVFPASLQDCTIVPYDHSAKQGGVGGGRSRPSTSYR